MAFEILGRTEYREFGLVQGDTLPAVKIVFLDTITDALDITGYTIDFFFRKSGLDELLNINNTSCVITDGTNGLAEYRWTAGDTDLIGIHFGEFQLQPPGGGKQTIRNAIRFDIREQVQGVSGFS